MARWEAAESWREEALWKEAGRLARPVAQARVVLAPPRGRWLRRRGGLWRRWGLRCRGGRGYCRGLGHRGRRRWLGDVSLDLLAGRTGEGVRVLLSEGRN